MIIQFEEYLTLKNIYYAANFGILPFWLLLIIIPNSRITQIFVNSIVVPLILSTAFVYLIYQAILLEVSFLNIFELYLSIDNLYTIFSTEIFLLAFWLIFLSLSLFLGSWVSRDALKYGISKKLVALPLVLIYLSGPLGLLLFWCFRIFYAKKLGLHD